MIVGVLTITVEIPGANSLKDKRQVLKSILDGIRKRFNVSAAEIADNDVWRRATFAVACVSNDKGVANGVLDKVADFVESNPAVNIMMAELELI